MQIGKIKIFIIFSSEALGAPIALFQVAFFETSLSHSSYIRKHMAKTKFFDLGTSNNFSMGDQIKKSTSQRKSLSCNIITICGHQMDFFN